MLAQSLKRFRKTFHLTQKQVAQSIDIHERLYQRYEAGEVTPSVDVVSKIANSFDVSADYLLGRTDNPNSHKL